MVKHMQRGVSFKAKLFTPKRFPMGEKLRIEMFGFSFNLAARTVHTETLSHTNTHKSAVVCDTTC